MGLLTDLLLGAVAGAAVVGTAVAVGYVAYKLYKHLTADNIREEAQKALPGAQKVRIKGIKQMLNGARRVECNVFGNGHIEKMTIEAEDTSGLHEGQAIYV